MTEGGAAAGKALARHWLALFRATVRNSSLEHPSPHRGSMRALVFSASATKGITANPAVDPQKPARL